MTVEGRMNVLIIIPARGGSKGIPRKNLRSLAGHPLLYYSIQTALGSSYKPDVYVTSDDGEILSVAEKLGAKTHHRDSSYAQDNVTLDPVIYQAYTDAITQEKKRYDLVVTLQPTSPLLTTQSLDAALHIFEKDAAVETVIAALNDTHLSWRREDGRYLPNYEKRVNRQYLTPTFREAGAFLISRASVVTPENRIGSKVELALLNGAESIDIDTFEDWSLCEYYLKRKKVLFVVAGYADIGLGHVYNTLLLANDMIPHDIHFLVDRKSDLALEAIRSHHYQVTMQQDKSLSDEIEAINPDMVINDLLDTDTAYVQALKDQGRLVVNFEDLGPGSARADLVVNAIYPEKDARDGHYFGPDYFVLRDEFVLSPQKKLGVSVKKVLVTFGGVDPENLTHKVLSSIYSTCAEEGIELHVAAGFGYKAHHTLTDFPAIHLHRNTRQISDLMLNADLIFTSAGRTVYEIASLGVPAIVLAQNQRELTHFFAKEANGFINLGLGRQLSNEQVLQVFKALKADESRRLDLSRKMKQIDLRGGRKRVQRLIRNLLEV